MSKEAKTNIVRVAGVRGHVDVGLKDSDPTVGLDHTREELDFHDTASLVHYLLRRGLIQP